MELFDLLQNYSNKPDTVIIPDITLCVTRVVKLRQPCNKSEITVKLVPSCPVHVDNLGHTVRKQLVNGLLIDLLQVARFFRVCGIINSVYFI